MKIITRVLLALILVCSLWTNAQAALQYRNRLPFTLTILPEDKLDVRYDFSAKGGLSCTSSYAQTKIDFTYKGRNKSAYLPVTLQSTMPDRAGQELADMGGRFHLTAVSHPKSGQEITISCRYIRHK